MDRSLLVMYCLHFLIYLIVLLMTPFYSDVASSKGLNSVLVGLVFSVMPGTAVLFTLCMPYVYAFLSKKKAIMLGFVLQTGALGLMAASDFLTSYEFFALGLVSRVLSGVSMACVETSGHLHAVYSIAVSTYTERVKEIFGLLESLGGISVMIGPVISAPLYSVVGFQLIFIGAAAVFLLCSPLTLLLRESRSSTETKAKYGVWRVLSCRVRPMQVMLMDAVADVYAVTTLGVSETYVSSHLLSMGLPMTAIGGAIGAASASYTLSSFLMSRVLSRLNAKKVIAVGLALATVAIAFLGPPPQVLPGNFWVVIAAVCLTGFSVGLVFVPSIPHMLEVAPAYGFTVDDDLSDVLGSIAAGAFPLGETIGPLLGGVLLDFLSFPWMTVVVSAAGVICLAAYIFLTRVDLTEKSIPMDSAVTKALVED